MLTGQREKLDLNEMCDWCGVDLTAGRTAFVVREDGEIASIFCSRECAVEQGDILQ